MARISRKLYCGGGVGAICNMRGQTTAIIGRDARPCVSGKNYFSIHAASVIRSIATLPPVHDTKPTLLPSAGIFGGDDEGIVGTTSGHNRLISQG